MKALFNVAMEKSLVDLTKKPEWEGGTFPIEGVAHAFVKAIEHYDGWPQLYDGGSRLWLEVPLTNGKTLADPLYNRVDYYKDDRLQDEAYFPVIDGDNWIAILDTLGFIFHKWLTVFLPEGESRNIASSVNYLKLYEPFLKLADGCIDTAKDRINDIRINSRNLYKGPKKQLAAPSAIKLFASELEAKKAAESKVVEALNQRLADAIKQHHDAHNRIITLYDKGQYDQLEREYPQFAPGNMWNADVISSLGKGSGSEPPRLSGRTIGYINRGWMRAMKALCDNHMFSLMQHTSSQCVDLTYEPKRNVINPRTDRLHDMRLTLERRQALFMLICAHAEELGIVWVSEGVELHGSTKEKKGGLPAEVKEKAAKKKKSINKKKRGLHPQGGGSPEASDEPLEARVDWAEFGMMEEQEKLQNATMALQTHRARCIEMMSKFKKALLGENPKTRIGPEGDDIGKKLWADFSTRFEAVKKAKEDYQASAEVDLGIAIEQADARLEEIEDIRKATGVELTVKLKAERLRLKKGMKSLMLTLPNTRVNLAHGHLSLMYKLQQNSNFDPMRLSRLCEAPRVIHCRCNVEEGPDYRFYCITCNRLPDPVLNDVLAEHMKKPCAKREGGGPCYFEARCAAKLRCAPCNGGSVRYYDCTRRHCPIYYANPKAFEAGKDGEHGPLFPQNELNMGALVYSVIHGGGLGWEDVLSKCNYNRTTFNARGMIPYPFKQATDQLMFDWLKCAGHLPFTDKKMRLATIWLFDTVIDNYSVSQMFRNFIIKLTLACDTMLSFSNESVQWTYTSLHDLPAAQKKTDRDFYCERLVGFMRSNRYYVVDGSTSVVRIMDGFEMSVEQKFERLYSEPGEQNISGSFLAYLSSLEPMRGAQIAFGAMFRANPDLIGMLPRCRLVYEVIELDDGYFVMFPNADAIPAAMKEDLSVVDNDGNVVRYNLSATIKKQRDGSHLTMINYILRKVFDDVDRITVAKPFVSPWTLDVFCAHGVKTPDDWLNPLDDSPAPNTIRWLLQTPPSAWFSSIGKYALAPKQMRRELRESLIDPTTHWDGRKGAEPKRWVLIQSMHMGWEKFVKVCAILRTLLFRPEMDGQPWPFFHGPSRSGKSSFGDRWLRVYYPESAQCPMSGNFALANINDSKRIVLFEEFRGKKTIPLVSNFLRGLDVGKMDAEAKRKNVANTTNRSVKTGTSNDDPRNWYPHSTRGGAAPILRPEDNPDYMAYVNRIYDVYCGLRHDKGREDRHLGNRMKREWLLIVAYLAREAWRDELAMPRPDAKLMNGDPMFPGVSYSVNEHDSFPSDELAHKFLVVTSKK